MVRPRSSKRSPARPLLLAGLALACVGPIPSDSAPPPAPMWAVAFSPDGKTLAAGSYRQVQLWDVSARTWTRTLAGHAGPVRCLSWSADGKQLAAGGGRPGAAGEVKVWGMPADPAGGAPAETLTLHEHKDVVEGVAFSAAGDAILSAGVDEKVLAIQLASRKLLGSLTDHTSRVVAVAVSPNGKYVATGSLDRTIKLWSTADYKPLGNIDHAGGQVFSLAFMPAGDQLVAAGADGNVRIYRLRETVTGGFTTVGGSVLRTLSGNRTPVLAVATAARGGWMAFAGEDRAVHVFDAGGSRRHTLKECPDAVYSLAFSPDGSLLAAGCRDGKLRLWTTNDGKLATELANP